MEHFYGTKIKHNTILENIFPSPIIIIEFLKCKELISSIKFSSQWKREKNPKKTNFIFYPSILENIFYEYLSCTIACITLHTYRRRERNRELLEYCEKEVGSTI